MFGPENFLARGPEPKEQFAWRTVAKNMEGTSQAVSVKTVLFGHILCGRHCPQLVQKLAFLVQRVQKAVLTALPQTFRVENWSTSMKSCGVNVETIFGHQQPNQK